MTQAGHVAHCLVRNSSGEAIRVSGRVVEASEESVVLGIIAGEARKVPGAVVKEEDGTRIGFLRVPSSACTSDRPSNWEGPPKEVPKTSTCKRVWEKVSQERLESSEAEFPTPTPKAAARKSRGLDADLKVLESMMEQGSESESEDSSVEDPDDRGGRGASSSHQMLPPGASSSKDVSGHREGKKSKKEEDSMQKLCAKLVSKGLEEGQSPSELLPLMMMSMLTDQASGRKKKKKNDKEWSLLGGSDSEDSGDGEDFKNSGMKAVSTLHKLHRRVLRHPDKVCREWEKEITAEMGVVPGQAWTVKEYLRRVHWGKFKGIYRCAVMDAQAYELIRRGDHQAGAAQLVQNMKSKIQSVISNGDWSGAWLLTGIPCPLAKKEFGGTKEEMAVVSGYLSSLGKLRKQVKDSQGALHQEEEGEEEQTHRKK